jgi:hypothetical protein
MNWNDLQLLGLQEWREVEPGAGLRLEDLPASGRLAGRTGQRVLDNLATAMKCRDLARMRTDVPVPTAPTGRHPLCPHPLTSSPCWTCGEPNSPSHRPNKLRHPLGSPVRGFRIPELSGFAGLPGPDRRPRRRPPRHPRHRPEDRRRVLAGSTSLEELRDSAALTRRRRQAVTANWDKLLAWRDIIRLNDKVPLGAAAVTGQPTAPMPRAAEILDALGLW